jgi:hypothetical protein
MTCRNNLSVPGKPPSENSNCQFCIRKEGDSPNIDSHELFSIFACCVEGPLTQFCETIFLIFSWADPEKSIHRFEFHYFLDSLFRALFTLIITKGHDMP